MIFIFIFLWFFLFRVLSTRFNNFRKISICLSAWGATTFGSRTSPELIHLFLWNFAFSCTLVWSGVNQFVVEIVLQEALVFSFVQNFGCRQISVFTLRNHTKLYRQYTYDVRWHLHNLWGHSSQGGAAMLFLISSKLIRRNNTILLQAKIGKQI